MKKDILWLENGWLVIQDADEKKHELEITALAKDGQIVEIRKRHNDGEEEVIKGSNANIELPMALDDFKKGLKKGLINLK